MGTLVVWDYPSLGVKVNLLQYSSVICIVYDPVGFWMGSEFGSPLWDILYSETLTSVGLQLILEISPGSKIRYSDLVVSPSRATLSVPPSGYFPKFPPTPYVTCITSPSQATLTENISGAWPTLPWNLGRICHCREAKGDKRVEITLEVLVGLGVFLCPPSHHRMWFDFRMVC